jgi:imidazolonepropionase-like amidohydrolase
MGQYAANLAGLSTSDPLNDAQEGERSFSQGRIGPSGMIGGVATAGGQDMLAIRVGRAFDGEQMLADGVTVFVDEGIIAGVEPGAAPVPDGCAVSDFGDATLLPGLIEMHTHLGGDGENGALDRIFGYTDDELEAVIERSLRAQLSAGVTTVRDLGDRRWSVLDWRDRLAAGAVPFPCPNIVAAGPPITTPGGHCWYMGGESDGSAELRAAVKQRVERRADVVKVMASGGVLTPGTNVMQCQFSASDLRLVVEEAHAAGLPVTAHAHGVPAVMQAIDAGVDGIEHCSCMTDRGIELSDALVQSLAASQIAVCPTLGRKGEPALTPAIKELMERTGMTWESRLELVGRMYREGVRIVSGADSGIAEAKPHGVVTGAIGDLVEGGVPISRALATGTSLAAEACGFADKKGSLRRGYDADLLVVDGDLGSDIGALEDVRAVMVRGVLVV